MNFFMTVVKEPRSANRTLADSCGCHAVRTRQWRSVIDCGRRHASVGNTKICAAKMSQQLRIKLKQCNLCKDSVKLCNSGKTHCQAAQFRKDSEGECSTRTNLKSAHSIQHTAVHQGLTCANHQEIQTSTLHLLACIENAKTLASVHASKSTTSQTLVRASHLGSKNSLHLFNQHESQISAQHPSHLGSKDTNVGSTSAKPRPAHCIFAPALKTRIPPLTGSRLQVHQASKPGETKTLRFSHKLTSVEPVRVPNQ